MSWPSLRCRCAAPTAGEAFAAGRRPLSPCWPGNSQNHYCGQIPAHCMSSHLSTRRCVAVCSGASLSHLASRGDELLDTPRLAEGSNLGRFLRDSARHHARASGDGGLLCAALSARLFVRCLEADLAWPRSASGEPVISSYLEAPGQRAHTRKHCASPSRWYLSCLTWVPARRPWRGCCACERSPFRRRDRCRPALTAGLCVPVELPRCSRGGRPDCCGVKTSGALRSAHRRVPSRCKCCG